MAERRDLGNLLASLPDPRTTLLELRLENDRLQAVADASLRQKIANFAHAEALKLEFTCPEPERQYLGAGRAYLLAAPDPESSAVSEAIYGEALRVYDSQGNFSRVQTLRDDYFGWLETRHLVRELSAATHRFAAPRGHVLAEPKVSSKRLLELSLGCKLKVTGQRQSWLEVALSDGEIGFVKAGLLEPLNAPRPNDVKRLCDLALRFLETPYVWGGVSAWGLDCSGLVQTLFAACGIELPRDADQQEATGESVSVTDTRAGDLLFFPGHVALALDGERFIHANEHNMRVTVDTAKRHYGAELLSNLNSVKRHL